MEININLTTEELKTMKFNDEFELVDHIIDTLDANKTELVGYTVNVNTKEDK